MLLRPSLLTLALPAALSSSRRPLSSLQLAPPSAPGS
ncbi:hypothetical protein PVAP13_2KG113116 [Panicum virgatum]|uniref:Uncharacterized protein n=1 Tax=Panicum virgatum TaxID=38727 RepID=A0A8T0W221_PANVG|nr:hypothetical protein PVAP13_2KG113116 [Panicum virgatum]